MRIIQYTYICLSLALSCFGDMNMPVEIPRNYQEKQALKKFFLENGYLWIKDYFSDDQVATLRDYAEEMDRASQSVLKKTDDFSTYRPEADELIIVPERNMPSKACRVEDMLTIYPELREFMQENVTNFINDLIDEPYVFFKDKLNFKWPGGGAFSAHQDFPAYSPLGPKYHLTAMILIDNATVENGALQVAKHWATSLVDYLGEDFSDLKDEKIISERKTLPFIIGGKMHGTIEKECTDKIEWLQLLAGPKDLVLIDSFVPHYSEPNRSQGSRRLMIITHNKKREGDMRSAYYDMKRNDPNNPLFHIGTPTKARGK